MAFSCFHQKTLQDCQYRQFKLSYCNFTKEVCLVHQCKTNFVYTIYTINVQIRNNSLSNQQHIMLHIHSDSGVNEQSLFFSFTAMNQRITNINQLHTESIGSYNIPQMENVKVMALSIFSKHMLNVAIFVILIQSSSTCIHYTPI